MRTEGHPLGPEAERSVDEVPLSEDPPCASKPVQRVTHTHRNPTWPPSAAGFWLGVGMMHRRSRASHRGLDGRVGPYVCFASTEARQEEQLGVSRFRRVR